MRQRCVRKFASFVLRVATQLAYVGSVAFWCAGIGWGHVELLGVTPLSLLLDILFYNWLREIAPGVFANFLFVVCGVLAGAPHLCIGYIWWIQILQLMKSHSIPDAVALRFPTLASSMETGINLLNLKRQDQPAHALAPLRSFRVVVFVSHRWVTAQTPDPNNTHHKAICAFVRGCYDNSSVPLKPVQPGGRLSLQQWAVQCKRYQKSYEFYAAGVGIWFDNCCVSQHQPSETKAECKMIETLRNVELEKIEHIVSLSNYLALDGDQHLEAGGFSFSATARCMVELLCANNSCVSISFERSDQMEYDLEHLSCRLVRGELHCQNEHADLPILLDMLTKLRERVFLRERRLLPGVLLWCAFGFVRLGSLYLLIEYAISQRVVVAVATQVCSIVWLVIVILAASEVLYLLPHDAQLLAHQTMACHPLTSVRSISGIEWLGALSVGRLPLVYRTVLFCLPVFAGCYVWHATQLYEEPVPPLVIACLTGLACLNLALDMLALTEPEGMHRRVLARYLKRDRVVCSPDANDWASAIIPTWLRPQLHDETCEGPS